MWTWCGDVGESRIYACGDDALLRMCDGSDLEVTDTTLEGTGGVNGARFRHRLRGRSIPISTPTTSADRDAVAVGFAWNDNVHTDGLCTARTTGTYAQWNMLVSTGTDTGASDECGQTGNLRLGRDQCVRKPLIFGC